MKLLVAGDSITRGHGAADGQGWRGKLRALAQSQAGVDLTIVAYAAGGWGTIDAAPAWSAVVLAEQPDVAMVALGTNDSWDVPGYENRLGKMIGAVEELSDAVMLASFIQYSTGPLAYLAPAEASINDAASRAYAAHGFWSTPASTRFAGVADFQRVPVSYLDSGGVHPTDAGYGVYSRIVYAALASHYGWPAYPYHEDPPLTGHRP